MHIVFVDVDAIDVADTSTNNVKLQGGAVMNKLKWFSDKGY